MRLPLLKQQVLDHYSFCGWPLLAWCHPAPDCCDGDAVDDDAGGGVDENDHYGFVDGALDDCDESLIAPKK